MADTSFPGDPGSRLHSIAFGNVIAAAANNLKKELEDTQKKSRSTANFDEEIDLDDLDDDPELERLHNQRLQAMMAASRRRDELRRKGHGEYKEITEEEFLPELRGSQLVVCHFYHQEFPRCKVMDKHLATIAPKHVEAKFVKVDAEKCPFFVSRLNVKVLPCVVLFRNAVAIHRIVGFEPFKKGDNITATDLANYLIKQEFLKEEEPDSDSEEGNEKSRSIRSSTLNYD